MVTRVIYITMGNRICIFAYTCATTAVNAESDTTPTDKLIGYFSDWYKLKLAVAVN